MKIKELIKIRGVFKYICITTIIFLIIVGLFLKLSISYQDTNIVKANMVNMQKTIDEYNNLATKINGETYRPIDKEQLDIVQTEILNNLAKHKLILDKFAEKETKKLNTNKKDSEAESFKEYDLSFVGDWAQAINMVTNFTNTSDALITIEKIQISSNNGTANNTSAKNETNTNKVTTVKVDMVYRIYIK